jgi:hypothetical protein
MSVRLSTCHDGHWFHERLIRESIVDALPGITPRSRRRILFTEELRERLVRLRTDDSVATGDEGGYAGHAVGS